MKEKLAKKNVIFIIFLGIILICGIAFGYSFAYFSADVINSNNPTNTIVTTTSLELEYTDGPEAILENSMPGTHVEKTFKVKNIGSGDTVYDVYMSEVVNTFVDKSDLVYTLESNDGGANITTELEVPSSPTKIVSGQSIPVGEEHNYKLKIDFKETNNNQDDNKNKEFKVTVRVNEVKDAPPSEASKYILNLAKDEDPTSNVIINKGEDEGDNCTYTMAYDGTADNNLRYIGYNPCNYVTFNNETWRIIGVMNNMKNANGQSSSMLKIVKSAYIGYYSWDSSDYNDARGNGGYGINQWGPSTYGDGSTYEGADLMRELNTDYLGNITVGTDGKWYWLNNNSKTRSMPSTTISVTSQNMIENAVWKLGSPANNNGTYDSNWSNFTSGVVASTSYQRERESVNGGICESANGCSDTIVRTDSWTGKVGLIYPSDYLYATGGGETTNRQTCLNTPMVAWRANTVEDCINNDWIRHLDIYYSTIKLWTLSSISAGQRVISIYDGYADAVNACGHILAVNPVVYLKSGVAITGGAGTPSNPYTLSY